MTNSQIMTIGALLFAGYAVTAYAKAKKPATTPANAAKAQNDAQLKAWVDAVDGQYQSFDAMATQAKNQLNGWTPFGTVQL